MAEMVAAASELNAVEVVGGGCCGLTCGKEVVVNTLNQITVDGWKSQAKG